MVLVAEEIVPSPKLQDHVKAAAVVSLNDTSKGIKQELVIVEVKPGAGILYTVIKEVLIMVKYVQEIQIYLNGLIRE